MPYWAELEKEGFVQVGEPEVVGALDEALADGAGLLPEVGVWPADADADAEADADADADRDFDADRDGDALAVRDERADPVFGMTATRGVAATCGMPAALAASSPAVTWRARPSLAVALALLS